MLCAAVHRLVGETAAGSAGRQVCGGERTALLWERKRSSRRPLSVRPRDISPIGAYLRGGRIRVDGEACAPAPPDGHRVLPAGLPCGRGRVSIYPLRPDRVTDRLPPWLSPLSRGTFSASQHLQPSPSLTCPGGSVYHVHALTEAPAGAWDSLAPGFYDPTGVDVAAMVVGCSSSPVGRWRFLPGPLEWGGTGWLSVRWAGGSMGSLPGALSALGPKIQNQNPTLKHVSSRLLLIGHAVSGVSSRKR